MSRLGIRYIVDENLIKRINGLANDEIHFKEKVYIPIRKVAVIPKAPEIYGMWPCKYKTHGQRNKENEIRRSYCYVHR